MPRGVWLDTMQLTPGATSALATTGSATSATVTTNGLSSSGVASAPVGTTFTVTGNALSRDAVAGVLDRLAIMPALSDVSLQSMQRADVAARRQCISRSSPTYAPREGTADEGALTPEVVAAIGVTAVAAVALIGWFGLVSPQRSKAAELDSRIADAKTQLVVLNGTTGPIRRLHGRRAELRAHAGDAAERRDVGRAAASRARRVSGRREARLAHAQAATAQAGYSTVPMDVVVTGRYFSVQRFLKHLHTQAGVSGSRAHASGRL